MQRRAIRHRRTNFSAPVLRWAAIENYYFETLTKLQVDGELSILACAEKCQSIPECKSAFWGGIHEGCRYWSGDNVPFNLLYWGTASGWETPLKVLPVVFTVQGVASAFNRWYDPFEEIEPCRVTDCPGSMCADSSATHLRVRSTDANKVAELFDVRIYDCPHLQELHWMHHARIVENSLTNCTSLREVVFAGSTNTVAVDDRFVEKVAENPTTSCAFYPLLYFKGTTVKAMVSRTLTAFPTQDQYPDVPANADGLTLDLGYHHMATVHENAAESCPYGGKVAIVRADHNIITTVGPRAFSAFTDLTELDLSHNMITSISDLSLIHI